MQSKLPETLVIPLIEKVNAGLTTEQIVSWLEQDYSIIVSASIVQRRIRQFRDLEIEARKNAIAKRAGKQAIDYIDMIDEKIEKLNNITNRILNRNAEELNPEDMVLCKQMLEVQLKYIDKQMNLTGMDKPDTKEADEEMIIETLITKLGR